MTRSLQSAGVLAFRTRDGSLEVMLVHPGGPYWKNKDNGAWSIPKGEFDESETPLEAARREFEEETGRAVVAGEFVALTPRRLRSGKIVHAFAVEDDFEVAGLHSNHFTMQWPPGSGQQKSFPEVDRYAWFSLDEAMRKINVGQQPFLAELSALVAAAR